MIKTIQKSPIIPFILRFSTIHTLTYLVFGIFFMLVSRYFEYFNNDPIFELLMKPSDSLSVRLAPFAQLFRGALLALAIFPFRELIIGRKLGWLNLFILLFALTSVGAVITGPGSIEGFLYTRFSFNPFIGYPEIALQMLAFSWLFCRWQGQKTAKINTK